MTKIKIPNWRRRIQNNPSWTPIKLTEQQQEAVDRVRYESMKKAYYLHDSYVHAQRKHKKKNIYACSSGQCIIACEYFPPTGTQTEEGEISYDDPNLDPEFWGEHSALLERKKIWTMSPEELDQYKKNLDIKYEYDEATQKAIAEGKKLYVRSGSYPTYDDPTKNPNAQYYEYKT